MSASLTEHPPGRRWIDNPMSHREQESERGSSVSLAQCCVRGSAMRQQPSKTPRRRLYLTSQNL